MPAWWSDLPDERYWCEITDRPDLGADLKCPQTDESGKPHWCNSLIREVRPGDIVFHYWKPQRAIVGASVAGGPLEDRPIVWAPHGTVGRAKDEPREPRSVWPQPSPPTTLEQRGVSVAHLVREAVRAYLRRVRRK